eukprot:13877887-Heterocapsa_arctica.AAC.1
MSGRWIPSHWNSKTWKEEQGLVWLQTNEGLSNNSNFLPEYLAQEEGAPIKKGASGLTMMVLPGGGNSLLPKKLKAEMSTSLLWPDMKNWLREFGHTPPSPHGPV